MNMCMVHNRMKVKRRASKSDQSVMGLENRGDNFRYLRVGYFDRDCKVKKMEYSKHKAAGAYIIRV